MIAFCAAPKKEKCKNGNETNYSSNMQSQKRSKKYNSKESHPKEMTMGKQAC